MNIYRDLLDQALRENKIWLPDSLNKEPITRDTLLNKLAEYLTLLQTWNRVFNLTSITEPRDMVYLHIIDSLMVNPYVHGTRCLDVGTGAGLPGIPLAICDPQKKWTLLDKNSKKTRFLIQVIAELKLTNVEVVQSRALDFHPDKCFDSILSRALGTISLFIDESEHLLCKEGKLLAMKGKYPQDELDDIPKDFHAETFGLAIKGISIERHLVCLSRKSR